MSKEALQKEIVGVKGRWAAQIKLTKTAEGPHRPLPVSVARTYTDRPESASMFDVDEFSVRLWLDQLDTAPGEPLPVRAEVIGALPSLLLERMGAHLTERWRSQLSSAGAGAGAGGWLFEPMLEWVEGAWSELLWLCPELVEQYDGVDDNGITIRRCAIVEPRGEEPEESEEEEEEEEEESEEEEEGEEDPSVTKEAERLERIRLAAEREADRQFREARRREAEELGDASKGYQGVSKKEQQALIKAKQEKRQGARLRKQGAKANKFDAEAAGAKKNKKNGLLH